MQERYLGDIHDFYKFLFIKHLAINLKVEIGLNWFLVDPKSISKFEMKKNDGEKRNYLNDPRVSKFDEKLTLELSNLINKKNRNLKNLKNYSEHTVKSYTRDVIKFFEFPNTKDLNITNIDNGLIKIFNDVEAQRAYDMDPKSH